VLLLSSGVSSRSPLAGESLSVFRAAVLALCQDLARAIVDDGEGVSHRITIEVQGCASRRDARQIAKTIANSVLVKTAIAGADPNWGRILSAAGYAGVAFDPAGIGLYLNGHLLFDRGAPVAFERIEVSQSIRNSRETHVLMTLAEGTSATQFWTSDLTTEYIRQNAEFHT
jgi:glutamate N-acetyltransferase/amino-acid N-acetyltransferase